eukprot:Em0004g3a
MEAQRQEELKQQYLKEQETFKNKELMGKANPLGFMYEPPPGFDKEKDKQRSGDGTEPVLKFEWQKEGRAAPREEHAKGMDIRDKPFGIEVRNVKCLKCGKWGHVNTDKECPLFGKAKAKATEGPIVPSLPDLDTVEDGLIFKKCVRDRVVDLQADNQQIIASDEETEMQELLAQFPDKKRRKILKKLAKMESKEVEKPKKPCKHKKHSDSGSSSEESRKKTKSHHKHHHGDKKSSSDHKRRDEKHNHSRKKESEEIGSDSEQDRHHKHREHKTEHRSS